MYGQSISKRNAYVLEVGAFSEKWVQNAVALSANGVFSRYDRGKLVESIDINANNRPIKYGADAVRNYGHPGSLPDWADESMLVCVPKGAIELRWLLFPSRKEVDNWVSTMPVYVMPYNQSPALTYATVYNGAPEMLAPVPSVAPVTYIQQPMQQAPMPAYYVSGAPSAVAPQQYVYAAPDVYNNNQPANQSYYYMNGAPPGSAYYFSGGRSRSQRR